MIAIDGGNSALDMAWPKEGSEAEKQVLAAHHKDQRAAAQGGAAHWDAERTVKKLDHTMRKHGVTHEDLQGELEKNPHKF